MDTICGQLSGALYADRLASVGSPVVSVSNAKTRIFSSIFVCVYPIRFTESGLGRSSLDRIRRSEQLDRTWSGIQPGQP